MARAHFIKKARKDNPAVKKGQPYWWWEFPFTSGKHYSATQPRPSQLTQSAYYSGCRSLVEMIEDYEITDKDSIDGLKEEVGSGLEELREASQDSLDNIPDELQYSPTGELLQARVEACENAESEIDSLDDLDDEPELTDFVESENPPSRDNFETSEDYETGVEQFETGKDEFKEAKEEWLEALKNWSGKDTLTEAVSECEGAG